MCPVICDAMKNRFLIRKILFRQDINLLLVKLVSSKRYQVKSAAKHSAVVHRCWRGCKLCYRLNNVLLEFKEHYTFFQRCEI